MITVKNSHEQARMREAGKIVGDTLRFIEPYVKPGVSTAELDNLMENYICSRGAKPTRSTPSFLQALIKICSIVSIVPDILSRFIKTDYIPRGFFLQ